MTTILGLSGSLRSSSINSALLRAAAAAMPAGATLEIGSIRGIPLYDGDVESAQGIPDAVTTLKERIVAANGLLLVTPEYNNSIPGVFKNAIDWLSRPANDIPRVFGGLPVGMIGASPGRFGTLLSQSAWLAVLKTLGTQPWFGQSLYLSGAHRLFDASGNLADEESRKRVQGYVAGFAGFVSVAPRQR
jgi:chromate reductase, NAD(P)H dehydrogenase (quinone)